VRELWAGRHLVGALTERELRARYKQAVLGFAWAFVAPLALLVVFGVIFTKVAHVDTGGAPYALFAYIGLLVWTFFSTAVSGSSQSLLTNAPLLNRVYCPREVFPLGSVGVAAVDTLTALLGLIALFPLTGTTPTFSVETVPELGVLVAVAVAFTVGLSLLASVLVVYFRDLRHLLPLLLQMGLLVTPVAYGLTSIPRRWQLWYAFLNPLAPVIDGLRRVLLYGQAPEWGLVAAGATTAAVVLVGGYLLFKRLETGLADIA
jgi:ABC-2 type transport system permease protein/lipopolysaccharide transport system permease protein